MKTFFLVGLFLFATSTAIAQDLLFEGEWRTTNRKLDGAMTCAVTPLENEHWKGRFCGVWQGVPFDHTVTFFGPPSDLRGTAVIDGADYQWTGSMQRQSPGSFKVTFGGSRYSGYFHLRQK